jgi:hypothetical protein
MGRKDAALRPVIMVRPFTGGMVTDTPEHSLGPDHSPLLQDGYSPSGVYKQRGGWAYDGSTADVADNLVGVYRSGYVLADTTRTITIDDDSELRIHNASSSGTLQAAAMGTGTYLPRCIYRDELIICAQDGLQPLRRYSGADLTGTLADGVGALAPDYTLGEATITGVAYSSAPPIGSYVCVQGTTTGSYSVPLWLKIVESSQTSILLDGIRASASNAIISADVTSLGFTFPAVSIYDAGTLTLAAGSITGYGTKWSTGAVTLRSTSTAGPDGFVVVPPSGVAEFLSFTGITDDDTLTGVAGGSGSSITDKSSYLINRRCNWIDAAAHKGSLWGTGNAYYPNRVYVSPVGWNPSFPPGIVGTFSPTTAYTSSNANDYSLDYVDVPSSFDGDNNVAILSSPNPLLVLKRNAVYGVYGSYPNFSVDMVADGIGCIDIRSAHSYDEGQFWAGEGGIYWYTGGQIIDLTAGRINREWRALTRDFDYGTSDYCTLGVSQGHLVVHITTGGGVTQRTYLCDLRDRSWQSRISNFTPRYLSTSRIAGEKEKLLAVSNARQGRVLDFAPALDGSGTAKDDAGDAPRLQFRTGTGIARANGIEGITRFVDLDVHANVYDAGAAASTVLDLSTVHGGGESNDADETKTLDAIDSDSTDRIDRKSQRVGRKGRLHQIRGEVSTLGTDSSATKVEIHQITATFRDYRGRA